MGEVLEFEPNDASGELKSGGALMELSLALFDVESLFSCLFKIKLV